MTGTGGCHTGYALNDTTTHADGKATFQTAPASGVAADNLAVSGICNNCHTTYLSGNIPTSGADLGKAQWDNASYKLPCETCHNGGTNTQATVGIDGSGNRAHNIEGTYFTNGHGAAGVPPAGIDNTSTGADSGLVDQVPPVRCETCHDEAGAHIGTSKDLTNPWRLDNAVTKYAQNGGLDNDCLRRCHSQTALPPRHARIVTGVGSAPQDNTVNTHPSSTAVVGSNKGRWFQQPELSMPLQDNLSTKSPVARSDASLLVCVTCHDPHGVGSSALTTRTFSGANDNGFQMLRFKSGAITILCDKCHK